MAFFGLEDLSALSNVDLTIYRYVTQNSDKVAYMRVRDIAKITHVANSSVMRFVHKMGFSSFPEFKAFIQNQGNSTAEQPLFNFINQSNFPADIVNKVQMVADVLYQSDNIILVGMGSSAFLANYATRQLASLGYNSSVVTDPFYPLGQRLKNTSNNTLICYSVSGESEELIALINDFINNDDITIASITGNEASTIARMSRCSLTYKEQEYRIHRYYDLSSQIPALYITEALISVLNNRNAK